MLTAYIQISGITEMTSCISCADGTVDLTVSGGLNPYTFLWSSGSTEMNLNGVFSGVYSVIVTDSSSCVQTDTFSIDMDSIECPVVESLWSDREKPFSARLHWEPATNAWSYQIRGRRVGTTNWTFLNVAHNAPNFKDALGLSNNSSYEWQIRTNCDQIGAAQSVWSAMDTFTTGCYAPDSIWTDPVSSAGAGLNWTRADGARI